MAVVTFSNIKGSGGGSGTLTGITFLNSEYTLEFIESAVTDAVDSALTAYTRTEDFATINGSAITEGGNIEIEGTNYSAGANINIDENNVVSVTGITVPTDISDLNDDIGIATTAWTNSAITEATSGLAATTYVDDAVSGKMDTSAMSAYTPTSGFSTINGSAITSGDNLIIEGTPYSGGTGIGVENHIISVTGDYETVVELTQAEYDALTAYSENTTYIITDAPAINMSAYTPTSGFSTINGSAITTGDAIVIETGGNYSAGTNIDITNDIISVTGITVPTKLSDLTNDEGFITQSDIPTSNTAFTNDAGYVNSGDVQTQINESISGKADSSAVTAQISEVKSEIEAEIPSKVSDLQNDLNFASTGDVESMISGFTTSADVQTQIESYNYINSGQAQTQIDNSISGLASTTYVDDAVSGKQDTSAMTEYYTSAQTDTAISNATSGLASTEYVDNSVSGKADSSDVTADIAAATAATTGWVENQGYLTGFTESDPVFMASAASGITANDIQNWNSVSGKQDTLISGTNIKTINNESILGSGNIVISGGSGSANIIELTQAEYDALTAYTEDAMYVITDAQEINMDNYATTGDIQTALDSYYTSAQTDTAISNAVSGKTDKVSVTANTGRQFPRWNSQGVVTGTTGNTVYERNFSVNGTSKTMLQTTNSDLPSIYAPTSAGTAGQPLLSNGSGAPVWGSYKFQFISQSAYDAITTKDSTTIYFIIDEN